MRDVELIAERGIPELVSDFQDCDGQGGRPHGPDQHQFWKIEPVESPLRLPESVQNAQPEQEQGEEKGRLKLAKTLTSFINSASESQD